MKQEKLSYSKDEKLRNMKKMKEFREIFDNSSLDDTDKKNIEFILEYFQGKHDPKISSRSFIFHGDPGVGKTFLAEKLINLLEVEVLYMANTDFSFTNSTRYHSFKEIIGKSKNNRRQVLFLDDLGYLFNWVENSVSSNDKRYFMQILELVKRNPNKVMITTLNCFHPLDERMIDRIEVKIKFDIPSNYNKLKFLDMGFKDHLSKKMRDFISKNSIGYNYRDLPEMIKLAYRLGKSKITKPSLQDALRIYKPTQLYGYDVQNAVDIGLNDVIGKPGAMSVANRMVQLYKNEVISEKLKLKRGNLLLFHGPPGTGKTFMARALAGEIGFPLINIHGGFIHGPDPFRSVNMIARMAKRYRNCIILVDEAEKILGNRRYEEDNPILGELHQCLDGIDSQDVQSILIFAINDVSRFGETLLDRFVQVKFELPSYDERMVFFREKINDVKHHVKLDFTCNQLALNAERMSYRDMDRYWNDLMFYYLGAGNPKDISRVVNRRFAGNNSNEIMFN
jgi:transitional endoplasmic reticulum ATPase